MASFLLTDEQRNLIELAKQWWKDPRSPQLFQYSAPAGAGKSFVLHQIIGALGLKDEEVAPMTYTGTAALVMRMHGFANASTCHSWLYFLDNKKRKKEIEDAKLFGYELPASRRRFRFKPLDKSIRLICVDEASMIPEYIGKEIMRRHVKVIACGDLNQLPPIKDEKGFFLSNGTIYHLTKIMRQAEQSGIVMLSNLLRNRQTFTYGNYNGVLVIPPSMLTPQMLLDAKIILCATNATRDKINRQMRELLGVERDFPLPCAGERLVCRKNNWDREEEGVNLTNGMIGFAVSPQGAASMTSKHSYDMDFQPLNFPHITYRKLTCDYDYFNADYKTRNMMRERSLIDPRYEAKHNYGEKFELGYAITTHLSQGNQFTNGIYIEESLPSTDPFKLNYTGLTRFINHCIYVKAAPRTLMIDRPPETQYNKICVCSINGIPVM